VAATTIARRITRHARTRGLAPGPPTADGSFGFTGLSALRRTGRDNRREQVPVHDVRGVDYPRAPHGVTPQP
jgi:hypothetical protein